MNSRSVLEDAQTARPQVRSSGLLGDFTWTLLGNGIFSVCQWGIIIILAKLVTTEAVGQYSLSQAILGPVLMFAAFSLRSAVASDLKDEFTNREYLGFRLLTLGAGLSVAIVVAFWAARSTTVIIMVGIVGLIQSAELISDTLYGFHQRGGDLVRPATSMILKGTVGLVALIAGIYWGHNVLAGLAGLAATRAALLVFYDLRGTLGERDPALGIRCTYFPWRRHFHLFRVVFFLGLLALFSALIGTIPRYFIQFYLGSRELGVFAAITSLTAIGLMPVAAFGMAAFVRLARGFTDRRPSDVIKILGVLLGLSFAIGAGGITLASFAGPQILTLLFRREYAARTDLLLLTMVMGAIIFLSASLGVSLSAARIFKPQAILLASVGAVEAICCWVLVPRMGLTGAAAACVGAAVVQLVGTAYIMFTHLARLQSARPDRAEMKAVEKQSLVESLARLPDVRNYAATLIGRIEAVARPNRGRRVLEIGAAAGCLTIAFNEMGYECTGIEPAAEALRTADALANQLGQPCAVVAGRAERIPFPDQWFDIVITNSVLEHVADVESCFGEISRVLAPGGLFWFETASSMSPFQHEIRSFPLFGWYPDSIKKRIMWWAAKERPELVGHTVAPAINWFSDGIVRRELKAVGFGAVVDRWTLRRDTEGGRLHAMALGLIRSSRFARRIANFAIPECAYAAVKKS